MRARALGGAPDVAPAPALVPARVLGVLRTLRAHGRQAFLAGGAVRDLLRIAQARALPVRSGPIPSPPQDFHVATDALPEEVQRTFARVVPTGLAHGTVPGL